MTKVTGATGEQQPGQPSAIRDFTMAKYEELCRALLDNGYTPMTISAFLDNRSARPNLHSAPHKNSQITLHKTLHTAPHKTPQSTPHIEKHPEKRPEKNSENYPDKYEKKYPKKYPEKIVLLRHDVDRKIQNALKMAELEHTLGIRSTYYFRYPYTFKPDIIATIHAMGHEVGYHYETLSKARGDHQKAIALFEEELAAFREIPGCESGITTICMHGSPLSRYDNRDLWKHYDLKDYGLLGEAYLSMSTTTSFKGIHYFTDTGRTWANRHSVRDAMRAGGLDANANSNTKLVPVETTDDLARWIESSGVERLYLAVHPERWAVSVREWTTGCVMDCIINAGKAVLVAMR